MSLRRDTHSLNQPKMNKIVPTKICFFFPSQLYKKSGDPTFLALRGNVNPFLVNVCDGNHIPDRRMKTSSKFQPFFCWHDHWEWVLLRQKRIKTINWPEQRKTPLKPWRVSHSDSLWTWMSRKEYVVCYCTEIFGDLCYYRIN